MSAVMVHVSHAYKNMDMARERITGSIIVNVVIIIIIIMIIITIIIIIIIIILLFLRIETTSLA